MSIDTEIKGSPGSIEGAADWLSGTLKTGVNKAGDSLNDGRRSASSDWQGAAGERFSAQAGSAVAKIDDLASATGELASTLLTFASRLRSAQHRMATIRETASGQGLDVAGFAIQDPGPGPADPGPLPSGGMPSPAAVAAHADAVAVFQEHQRKVRAYQEAAEHTRRVQADLRSDGEALSDSYRGLKGAQWVLTAADIAGGSVGGVVEFNAGALKGTARVLEGDALRNLTQALDADPSISTHSKWYTDLDDAKQALAQADDLASSADDLERLGKRMPVKLGGALAIAGIGYDIATGKDPVEATVSGAGGFAASVATGALVGGAIGSVVPVGGTIVGGAVGAVAGAAAGIFTSGAIDSLFENGPDVSAAIDAGADAVGDTVDAIGDGLSSVGDAIGGLFG